MSRICMYEWDKRFSYEKQFAMCRWSFLMLMVVAVYPTTPAGSDPTVIPSCRPDQDACEFYLVLADTTTMFLHPYDDEDTPAPVVVDHDGVFHKRDLHNCSRFTNLTKKELSILLSADGYHKHVLLYNGSLPGPPIVVYEGQQVVVHLRNDLVNQATSLHFHGMRQFNTPWMDGAGTISHCPISPGETFTYRFLAFPAGTHWYHSHYGTQRTMGAHGPLIVLPHPNNTDWEEINRGDDKLPQFAKEYYLQVSDWTVMDSLEILNLVRAEAVSYARGFDISSNECYDSTKQPDGYDCGVMPFDSGLINGKGRKYLEDNTVKRPVPLEVFEVEQGSRYRFRVICASMSFGFRLSIDGHRLHVISTDGNDVRTKVVESLVIFSGERYDFWIDADDPQQVGAYWIRAETTERVQSGHPIQPHHIEAVLKYKGYSGGDPISNRTRCTPQDMCDVINCPYMYFNTSENLRCIPITELKRSKKTKTYKPENKDNFSEHFLNFHFAYTYKWLSTINGIQHVPPAAPPQIYPSPYQQSTVACDVEKCRKTFCRCTHKLDVPLGQVFQLVFIVTTSQKHKGNFLNGMSHMIHLHGYTLQVIKIGYPTYNASGYFQAKNPDIVCDRGSEYCNVVRWNDSSWTYDLPDYIREDPPEKDTVAVPVDGYVVVRARANNPGFWFMHCHTEFHTESGMAMYLQVGNVSEMNAAPEHMNRCGNSILTEKEFLSRVNHPTSPAEAQNRSPKFLQVLQWVTFGLGSIAVFLLSTIAFLLCKHHVSKYSEYTRVQT